MNGLLTLTDWLVVCQRREGLCEQQANMTICIFTCRERRSRTAEPHHLPERVCVPSATLDRFFWHVPARSLTLGAQLAAESCQPADDNRVADSRH